MPAPKTDKPIIFSAPMIRALFDGRKTQTRRLLNPQKECFLGDRIYGARYAPGSRLWVRETSAIHPELGFGYIHGPNAVPIEELKAAGAKIIPSIFMKRKDSRLTLEVIGVKVERVQDISAADAIAEGMQRHGPQRPQDEFRELWEHLNSARMDGAASWACNPWVYIIEFKTIRANIDTLKVKDERENRFDGSQVRQMDRSAV